MRPYRVVQADESKPRTRCRSWQLWVRTDERYPNGRYRYATKTFEGTVREAEAEARRWAQALDERTEAAPSAWTFDAWACHVDASKLAAGAITQKTHEKNAYFRKRLSEHMGGVRIAEITPAMVDSANIAMRADGLSGTSLSCIHAYGWGVMERAVRDGLAARNPFDSATRPRPDTPERKAMDLAAASSFAAMLDPTDAHHMALLLMMEAGLRRGECCALRWEDVDGGRLHVHRSLHDDGRDHPTKNGRPRVVPLTPSLADALDKRRKHQAAAMKACHARCSGSTRVLADAIGSPMLPSNVTRWWRRNRASFGMEGWTPHELRHTFCSNLAEADVHPKVMQQLMGHASERTSMAVYTHVHDGQLDDAIAALSRAKVITGS